MMSYYTLYYNALFVLSASNLCNLFTKNNFHFSLLSPTDSFTSSLLCVRDRNRQKTETETSKDMPVFSVSINEAVKTQHRWRSNHSLKKVSIYLIVILVLHEVAVIPALRSTRSFSLFFFLFHFNIPFPSPLFRVGVFSTEASRTRDWRQV